MADLIAGGATQEQAVSHEYPPFYESTGDRKERSLRHWYKVLSKKG